MYHLYILKCVDKTLYTGITTQLARRIKEHNSSTLGAKYTRGRRPVKLVYSKKFRTRSTASKAEVRIKSLSRAEKLKLIHTNSQTHKKLL
ncbi:MAG: GIY-YIG nuclease family protein [bacterium]|nr:GIY-YIG nuclease family protein [bacterium]